MPSLLCRGCVMLCWLVVGATAVGADDVRHLYVAASDDPAQLNVDVVYDLWLPPGVRQVRGIIVHQHGCGDGAERAGQTAAYDLHWRALAKHRDCALFGSSYHAQGECAQWSDPANGSADAFQSALETLAEQTGHPEIATAPWCLWGHSGGAVWAFRMFDRQPERCVAVFLRSGRPTYFDDPAEVGELPELTDAKRQVPVMCNVGFKERGHERFGRGWQASELFFERWALQGALVAFAPDPLTGHECGNSRFLAIPFFNASLAARLPAPSAGPSAPLESIERELGWLGRWRTGEISPADEEAEIIEPRSWLPGETVARIWKQYVTTGRVEDATPPAPPRSIVALPVNHHRVQLTWEAEPDFESGLREFIVYRDGVERTRVKHSQPARFAVSQFQQISYHDTPERPLPEMVFVDDDVSPGTRLAYSLATVNGSGYASGRSRVAEVRTSPLVFPPASAPRGRPDTTVEGLRSSLDIPYARSGDRELQLDLFRPDDERSYPAVVVIHGGGWKQGDRTRFRALAQALAQKGFVTAAISYRLSGEAKFPAALHDCKAAVRWLRTHAREHGILPERIGAVGGSAGGQLAALLGTSAGVAALEGEGGNAAAPSAVQAVVVLGGPVDLQETTFIERSSANPQESNAVLFLGATYRQNPDVYRRASPLHYLDANDPPFLFLDGEFDRPGERYVRFRQRLEELRIFHDCVIYGDGRHGCWNREPWFSPMVEEMARFLTITLHP